MSIKPSLAKGTRDFLPSQMAKRNYIFKTLTAVFEKYGYSEIQTPSFENLSTLMGKYGEEGDKLMFKILNSGDYLKKVKSNALDIRDSEKLASEISDRGLRYDLTVPFARFVVMNRNEIQLPFKRFQIQPVWRADRPQRGRYREFYQCDVDVVGSESLINEAEFVLIYDEALRALGLTNFTIKLNNRKILSGIAEVIGKPELIVDLTVAIDKLDKIGLEGVQEELRERGFDENDLRKLEPIINLQGSNQSKINSLKEVLRDSAIGVAGIAELEKVLDLLKTMLGEDDFAKFSCLEIDITLARGLHYYTGCIFEVKTNEVKMGSIGGGGRYDDLTGMFGWQGLTGVGVSFGADRIYDVLEELNLFPEDNQSNTQVFLTNFDENSEQFSLGLLAKLRRAGIAAEIYPESAKLKKQLNYAHQRRIPFVIFTGTEDTKVANAYTVKNMQTGEQNKLNFDEVVDLLQK